METILSDDADVSKGEIFDPSNREDLAKYYLKKHKILELLHNITAELVYQTPEDPQNFIIEYIEKLRAAKLTQSGHPCLFDETNVRSLFGIMDPAGNGFINHSQFKAGMDNLGIDNYDRNPPGSGDERIALNTFIAVANDGLLEMSSSFTK